MATEAARFELKGPQGGRRRTDLTHTGLLMVNRSWKDLAIPSFNDGALVYVTHGPSIESEMEIRNRSVPRRKGQWHDEEMGVAPGRDCDAAHVRAPVIHFLLVFK
jgi:hypothetical protein